MKSQSFIAAALGALIIASPLAAFAQEGESGSVGVDASVTAGVTTSGKGGGAEARQEHRAEVKANVQGKIEDRAHDRAEQEISRRIDHLNQFITRLNGAKHIEDGDKSALSATLQAQIAELTALNLKIQGDTSTTSLKEDVQSITKSYRIFALVLPQSAIMAAGDRAKTVAGQLETLSAKLKTRLDTAAAGGTDVSAQLTLLADMNAKTADAKVQAQAAIDGVSGLKPDNGDETVKASNLAALKAARTKIQAAQQDLKTAREDARKIMGGVKGKGEHKGEHTGSTTHE